MEEIVLVDRITIKVNVDGVIKGAFQNDDKVKADDAFLNVNDTLIVDRNEEIIEYYHNIFAGNQIYVKYHLEEYYGKDMKDHFIYEIALHRVLKKALIKYDKVFNKLLDDMNESKDYLEELKLNREEYLDLEEDCLNDIYFTIKTTCQLLYLTQKYLVKIEESYI